MVVVKWSACLPSTPMIQIRILQLFCKICVWKERKETKGGRYWPTEYHSDCTQSAAFLIEHFLSLHKRNYLSQSQMQLVFSANSFQSRIWNEQNLFLGSLVSGKWVETTVGRFCNQIRNVNVQLIERDIDLLSRDASTLVVPNGWLLNSVWPDGEISFSIFGHLLRWKFAQ